ncbi:myelin-associated glycoprotein-like [Anguilla anguilla]|uniref:myelin-associated glycoprotein-like n=1 Tax=Anguilla anguilla TaxID=7936 RepID=UPI0015AC42E0|nr:myelin-associated glycoprotein-like [Anguilla anguilla]
MIEAERFILIGCLLQGALGRKFEVWMPQSIEALSGSCVLIPCRFDIDYKYDNDLTAKAIGFWRKRLPYGKIVFNSSRPDKKIKGTLIGKLEEKNCTTILNRFLLSHTDTYFFRLESQTPLMYVFPTGVKINVQDSPPKPKITPERVEVMEGTSVSLSCFCCSPLSQTPPKSDMDPQAE